MDLLELLKDRDLLVSDGAWGTELAKKGYSEGCPELLNIEHPDVIREVALSYVEAGSDMILTNTFGGNPFKLTKYGLEDRLDEFHRAAVAISREAADGRALVVGSMGPTGEFMAPLGLVTEDEMTEAFARQVRPMAAEGIDVILCETMTDLSEITCALRAAKENADVPVICSMTFDKGLRGYATMMGVTPADAAKALEEAGADAVGSNCGSGIDNIIEVAALMHPATSLPLWFKPNAGLPELIEGKTVYRESPEDMAAKIPALVAAGASIVGGCCGSTPAHIAAIHAAVDGLRE